MKKTLLFFLLAMALGCQAALAKELRGKVVDEAGQGLRYVNCVLRSTADYSYIASAVTAEDGTFRIETHVRDCTLSLAMTGYESKEIACEAGNLGTIQLRANARAAKEEKGGNVPPVVMRNDTMTYNIDHKPLKGREAPPPLVIKDNTLIYNIREIPIRKTVTTAHELLRELPSILCLDGDRIDLVGAKTCTIILTGTFISDNTDTPINAENLLKSLPASKVKRVVIHYDAPQHWFIKGPVINVILRR